MENTPDTLKPFRVNVTLTSGRRLRYIALATCSASAMQGALIMHGIENISVGPCRKFAINGESHD